MPQDYSTWEGRRALTDNPATTPEAFLRAGRGLLEQGHLVEAVEFLARAGDEEGLKAVQARAVAEGHFFVYQGAASRLPEGRLNRAEIQELMENAEKAGLDLYAAQARSFLEKKL